MTDLSFLNWAFKVIEIVDSAHRDNKTADIILAEVSAELESGFKALYDIAVAEDDDYVHVDDAFDYVADNYDPPEWDR